MRRLLYLAWMIVLVAVSAAAALTAMNGLWITVSLLALMAVAIMFLLWRFQERPYSLMWDFIEAVRVNDLSFHLTARRLGREEHHFVEGINAMLQAVKNREVASRKQQLYYETLLGTVDSCLFILSPDGSVVWQNRASIEQLCGHAIHHIEELSSLGPSVPSLLHDLRPGEVKPVQVEREGRRINLAASVTLYNEGETNYRLVNLRNIHSLLEEKELDAWQKLIRVLTHEIMNSMTPIISLSETLVEQPQEEAVMKQALATIHRRSEGLVRFVENYRTLTRVPNPHLEPVEAGELIEGVHRLVDGLDYGVYCHFEVEEPSLRLNIDRGLIEQVLLNLVKNGVEACEGVPEPRIVVRAVWSPARDEYCVGVTDNGAGILPDVLEKIFVPFFTTKPQGSGIGLSLCRHIMSLHGGELTVRSTPGSGSCFTMSFPHSAGNMASR